MAAEAGSSDRRHIPTWKGNAAKWKSFRDEMSVATRRKLECEAEFGSKACLWIVRSCTNDVYPPTVATADERRNVAGLDNVMNEMLSSPLVKKLPARKNELLHAFFRDDSLARTKSEPIAM